MFAITIRERSGQVYTFHFDKPEVLIGRVKGNDVILPKQNISKRHTLVKSLAKRFIVEDLGSTNGTYVNGHRITTAVEVGPDDKVYLGDFVMNFTDLSDVGAVGVPDVPDVPDMPEVPDTAGGVAGQQQPEAQSMRATQHMAPPSADAGGSRGVPPPTIPPVAPVVDPLSSDLPQVEPLDLPAELMDLSGGESPQEFLDRMTGPLDGLQHAMSSDAFKPELNLGRIPAQPANQSPLSAIPGLAGAIKAPSQPKPVSKPSFAPVEAAIPSAAKADAAPRPPEAVPAAPPAAVVAPARAPNTGSARPSVPIASGAAGSASPADAYYDALGALFRAALTELRASLPGDASQMSEADWTEMEDRVNAFVDAAHANGALPAGVDDACLRRDLIYELTGLGPLEAMLDDPAIEAIEINSPAQILTVSKGSRTPVERRFSCQQALALAVDRLVRATGQSGRTGSHMEGTLVDGTSVYVVWPPMCPAGPAVVLRKPRADAPSLADLVLRGMVGETAAQVLAQLVGMRRSVAIVGPVGVGKRTVLNALGQQVDASTRIVVLEDGQRLRLGHDQVVRIDAAVFGEGNHSPLRVVQRLRPECLLLGDTASVSLDDLFSVANDALPPWIGVFVARDAADLIERATHALMLRHPGLHEATAQARVLRGLDTIAVFVPSEHGYALSSVCEVLRHGAAGEQLIELALPGAYSA
ncbi:MAG: Flp pilus assembly complex ATPase component TadA [Deltaproteobacteria bacterium]|nr:Flp pilus assembly complex ATPase component TadA [Deltaproteobacteria bacterium]